MATLDESVEAGASSFQAEAGPSATSMEERKAKMEQLRLKMVCTPALQSEAVSDVRFPLICCLAPLLHEHLLRLLCSLNCTLAVFGPGKPRVTNCGEHRHEDLCP
jgi:hypothetical protein